MNTEAATTSHSARKRCRPTTEGGCPPSSTIDDRKCRDRGLKERLDYSNGHAEALETAGRTYDEARTAYREKRHEAALKVQDMKHQVKHIIERIKCLIEQDRVVLCLDDAFDQVCKQLDCCEVDGGCCAVDFTFETKPPADTEKGDRKLARRIVRYEAEIAKAKDCFDRLAGEPAALEARVADVKKDIDEILAALADDAAKVDLKKQYARARVAKRKLSRVWNGFDDTTAYVDCLCKALKTWSDGVHAVAKLVGVKAVRTCAQEAEKAWCDALIGGPVAEILAVYDRLCGNDKPCGSDKPEESGDDHSDDCGCGEHEHHHDDGEESSADQAQSM